MTKTPWDTQPAAGEHQHLVWEENGKTIALVYTDKADAELIIRAVNSHQALVEALEAASEYIERHVDVVDGSYGEPAPNEAMKLSQEIGEALKLAKGA